MTRLTIPAVLLAALVFSISSPARAEEPTASRVFELRTYHVNPGKLDALNARFRDHTNRIFRKHGLTYIGYWTATDTEPGHETLVYLLAFPSREAATASWEAFRNDPEWQRVKAESEKDGGPLVRKVDSVFLEPTDYSPIR